MDTSPPHRIVVTGASGVLGQALLPLLSNTRVVCLTHRDRLPGRRAVTADLTQPRLGLAAHAYDSLAEWATTVIHLAAVTDFVHPEIERVNVDGTGEIVRFAERANAHLIHVSTAFVHSGDGATTGPGRYAASKLLAEQVVRSSTRLSATIARPSVVIGDSRTGVVSRYQGFYRAAGALVQGRLPIAPFDRGSVIDVIPQDLVARTLVALLDGEYAGRTVWLTSGGRAPTLEHFASVVVGLAAELGTPIDSPQFVDPGLYERFIAPVLLAGLPRSVRSSVTAIMGGLSLYMHQPEPFPTSVTEVLGIPQQSLPDLDDVIGRCLTRWVHDEMGGLVPEARAS